MTTKDSQTGTESETKLAFKNQPHSELLEMSVKAMKQLMNTDGLLSDLPYDVTIEEVNAQIAVAQGQSITVQILRGHDFPLSVIIPQHTCTVLDLRNAIERAVQLQQKRDKIIHEKISWKYIWKTYSIRNDDNGQVMDDLLTNIHNTYGVRNKSVLSFVKRIEHLNSKCKLYKNNLNVPNKAALQLAFKHLLVDHKHQFIYCYIPKNLKKKKIACTNWKRILMYLNGKYNSTNILKINGHYAHLRNSTTRLIDLPKNKINFVLENYLLFFMVRHPFKRFLSAYRNKLESDKSDYFQKRINRKLKLTNNSKISFKDFVSYIVTQGQIDNEHWLPMHQLCLPCYFNYSLIGRLETIDDDSQAIFRLLNVTNLEFPESQSALTDIKADYYFKTLTYQQIAKLYNIYQLDFQLFNYDWDIVF